jgi:hypothetical protein
MTSDDPLATLLEKVIRNEPAFREVDVQRGA